MAATDKSTAEVRAPQRARLPSEREAVTKTIRLRHATADGGTAELDCYVHVGLYPDGRPGELFLRVDRAGSTVSGFADAVAIVVSLGLQYGVPLDAIVGKLRGMRFEPMGTTGDADHPFAGSLLDAVGTWLGQRFLARET